MSKKLIVSGTQSFMGKEIPVVLGGFGKDKKCICDKTIAELHEMKAIHVRELISRNLKRFANGVDFIDIKKAIVQNDNNINDDLLLAMGYTNMELSKAEHIYILSERGYAKLIKIMDTDLAWKIHDQLTDEYFEMREYIQTGKPLPDTIAAERRSRAMLLNAKSRLADRMQKLYDRAAVKPEYQVLALQDFFAEDGVKLPAIALQGAKVTYDKGTIAARLGVLSKAGNPHAQAIGAVIKQLTITPEEIEAVPYHKNGHDGTDYQYTESVIQKVRTWLEKNAYPESIASNGKTCSVRYQNAIGRVGA